MVVRKEMTSIIIYLRKETMFNAVLKYDLL